MQLFVSKLRGLAPAVLALAALPALAAASPTVKSFEGVWRVAKVVWPAPNARINDHPQPGLQIFSHGYYAIVRDISDAPRKPSPPPADPAHLTDAEKISRYDEWAPFGASAGTYEVRGDTIVTHNMVAKQAGGMSLTEEATIRFEGPDTFVATGVATPGGPPAGRQTTYTRVR